MQKALIHLTEESAVRRSMYWKVERASVFQNISIRCACLVLRLLRSNFSVWCNFPIGAIEFGETRNV